MKYEEIKKMLEKYKAPFRVAEIEYGFNVCDSQAEFICECETPEDGDLICTALNFMAQSFSVIGEN